MKYFLGYSRIALKVKKKNKIARNRDTFMILMNVYLDLEIDLFSVYLLFTKSIKKVNFSNPINGYKI